MGFFKGIAKTLLFLINFAILLCAIAFITVGVIYKVNNAGFDSMSISTYAIVVGVIIALISFFGCYGACNGSGCLLTTYAVLMLTLFILQIVLAILAFIAIKNSDGQLDSEVNKYLTKIYNKIHEDSEKMSVVNELQKHFECCGVTGRTDPLVNNGTNIVIDSCCETTRPCTVAAAYNKSCTTSLVDFMETNATIIGAVAIAFGIFELVAAGFACCVKKRNTGRYV